MYQFTRAHEIQVHYIKGGLKAVQGDRIVVPQLTEEPTTSNTMGILNAGDHKSSRVYSTLSAAQTSYWNPAIVTNVTMAVTSTEPANVFMSMDFVNNTAGGHSSSNITDYAKKLARVLGLMSMISYVAVILFVWIFANFQGYLYFSAGEPVLLIKYSEWILGFIGIFAAVDLLCREINGGTHHKKFLQTVSAINQKNR